MREISLKTDLFPTALEGDIEFNNGRPGSAAAHWLRAAVEAAGYACNAPLQEDYGWGFWLDDPCPIWVSVGLADAGPGDAAKPEWVVSVTYDRPIFSPSQWFKKPQCDPLADKVFAAIERALAVEPAMTRLN